MVKTHKHGGDIYGHPGVLDFSANCNPFGMPEGVKQAAVSALEHAEHYPDVECRKLRKALEREEKIPYDNIICGNGAADLIFGLVLAQKPKKALLPAPTFAEYEQALHSVDCEIRYYSLMEEDGFIPGENLMEHITEETDMLFFCNPNNPTGVLADFQYVYKLAEKCRSKGVFLVLDECFLDFTEQPEQHTMKWYLKEFPELFLVKAFTKKYAMAGLRLGYGFCSDKEVLQNMRAVMQPWNVSAVAQAAGEAALQEKVYVTESLKELKKEKIVLLEKLKAEGLMIYGSEANYIFFRGPEKFQEKCLAQGICIRDCSNYEGLGNGYYRIAVRTREENERLVQVFHEILK